MSTVPRIAVEHLVNSPGVTVRRGLSVLDSTGPFFFDDTAYLNLQYGFVIPRIQEMFGQEEKKHLPPLCGSLGFTKFNQIVNFLLGLMYCNNVFGLTIFSIRANKSY